MSVDDFQNGEEAVAQMNAERNARQREREQAELDADPVYGDGDLTIERKSVLVSQVSVGKNIRPNLPEIHDLALSISQRGLLTPPLVRASNDTDDTYVLVAGHRRFAAINQLGWVTVDVDEIVDISEDEAFEVQLLENVQRVQLEPIQAARGLRVLMKRREGASAAEIGRSIGLSADWVRRHLKLLELPDEIQRRVSDGDVSVTIADLLRRQIDKETISPDEAVEIADQIASGETTAGEVSDTFSPPKSKDPKPAPVRGVHRPGDGRLDSYASDDLDDVGETAEPESREFHVPEFRSSRETVSPEDDGVPAVWDNSPIKERRDGEASLGQINAQLDRYLISWLLQHNKQVEDAIELPGSLDDLSAGDLPQFVRRCAQAILRADPSAAAEHPDAVNRVL